MLIPKFSSIKLNSFLFLLSLLIFSCNGNEKINTEYGSSNDTEVQNTLLQDSTQIDSTDFKKFKILIGQKLYDIGRDATDNSFPSGVKNARYKADIEGSELEIVFNENSECKISFQPTLHKEIVTKTTKWKFLFPNKIILEDNLFAKIEVTNNAFPLSEEKFYDYFLVMKDIEITDEGLRIDVRNTNRENFFAQYAIAEHSGEANNQSTYAQKILSELKFDYELVWRYLYYYGLP